MRRILLIENDVITREIYGALLCQHGYEVTCVTDFRTAWEKIQKEPPAAVVLDLVMPDNQAITLLCNVRADQALKHLPLIVYTSLFVPSVVEEAQEAGATRIFDKAHLSPEMLLDTVNHCLIPGQKAA